MHEDIRLRHRLFKTLHISGILVWAVVQVVSLGVYLKYQQAVFSLKREVISKFHQNSVEWGDYRVLLDFSFEDLQLERLNEENFKRTRKFDVTLVTQCSVNNLHHLIETLHRWHGPISVAVFSPGPHAFHAVLASRALRQCYPLRDFKINLVYPSQQIPVFKDQATRVWHNYHALRNRTACSRLLDTLRTLKGVNYALGNLPYPHNTLRNVAKRAIDTEYMFLLDVDVMPSRDVRNEFLDFASKMRSETAAIKANGRVVYVTPAFEMEENAPMPVTKTELLQAHRNGLVRVFHVETCPWCHKATKYDDWLAIPETNDVTVAFDVDWSQSWEPFYISTVDAPDHDERFKQYGFDRISQVCELHVAGFSFSILANSFVVHKGMKKTGEFHPEKEAENRKNWKIFNNEFKEDLKSKYPNTTRNCREINKREGKAKVNFKPRLQRNSEDGITKTNKENKDRDL